MADIGLTLAAPRTGSRRTAHRDPAPYSHRGMHLAERLPGRPGGLVPGQSGCAGRAVPDPRIRNGDLFARIASAESSRPFLRWSRHLGGFPWPTSQAVAPAAPGLSFTADARRPPDGAPGALRLNRNRPRRRGRSALNMRDASRGGEWVHQSVMAGPGAAWPGSPPSRCPPSAAPAACCPARSPGSGNWPAATCRRARSPRCGRGGPTTRSATATPGTTGR